MPVLVGAVSLCTAVHADMVPLSPAGAGDVFSPPTRVAAAAPAVSSSSLHLGFRESADFGALPLGPLPEPSTGTGQTRQTKSPQILRDGQNSLSLCLYALLSLGLCRWAPFVKKLHLGGIPEWYHSGGPYQIGHSFAVTPDCLGSVLACCFVQPHAVACGHLPQYYRETVASLLRKSQLTLNALASRGPP